MSSVGRLCGEHVAVDLNRERAERKHGRGAGQRTGGGDEHSGVKRQ